jgi:hypothetical protein
MFSIKVLTSFFLTEYGCIKHLAAFFDIISADVIPMLSLLFVNKEAVVSRI